QIGIDKTLVIAARYKTNLLRIGLLGKRESILVGTHAHLRLRHVPQREQRLAELLLRKPKEEVALILGVIASAQQQPASSLLGVLDARIVTGRQHVGADLACGNQKLIELQVIVAETARNRRTSGEILVHERTNHVALEALLMVHDVVRNAKLLGDVPRVVNVLDRAAAPLH